MMGVVSNQQENLMKHLLIARGLRACADGYAAVLLPAYLLTLGFGRWEVGLISTATLLGSALMTLALGAWGHMLPRDRLLPAAALLMVGTGLGIAGFSGWWPLLLVGFIGTLNPGAGDVSIFLPLEHARIATVVEGEARTRLFARYSLIGTLCAALGALAAAAPDVLANIGVARLDSLRGMFLLYGLAGFTVWLIYWYQPVSADRKDIQSTPLGPSRGIVVRLALLFAVDAFAGGLVVNSLLALWLLDRFGLSLAATGAFFFWSGLLTAMSQLLAPWVAKKIGLLNTMVFTHIPANLFLILAAFAPAWSWALTFLLLRGLLSQMDVPTRSAYVMAVVTPAERTAAASFTAVPRSLASATGPALSGVLLGLGWLGLPLIVCGLMKIIYDLALWRSFRRYKINS
ncbi:ABC transporter permease [Gammaproteobacteria bacterium]